MMTERFTIRGTDDEPVITDKITGKDYPTEKNSLIVLMNELSDENNKLKKQVGNLQHTRDFCADVCADYDRLEKEYKQLKEENTELKHDNKRMVKFIMSKGVSLKDYLEWLKEEAWE